MIKDSARFDIHIVLQSNWFEVFRIFRLYFFWLYLRTVVGRIKEKKKLKNTNSEIEHFWKHNKSQWSIEWHVFCPYQTKTTIIASSWIESGKKDDWWNVKYLLRSSSLSLFIYHFVEIALFLCVMIGHNVIILCNEIGAKNIYSLRDICYYVLRLWRHCYDVINNIELFFKYRIICLACVTNEICNTRPKKKIIRFQQFTRV